MKPTGGTRWALSHSAPSYMDNAEWFHLAATYQGGNTSGNSTAALKFYLNGQQVGTDTVDFGGDYSSDAFPDNDLYFGAYANLTRGLQGSLDGVRIYDHVLQLADVRDLIPSVWNGGTGDWHDAAKWSPSWVPGAGATATIPTGTPTISDTRLVGYVTVGGGASLRLQGGVTVTGDFLSLVGGSGGTRGELRNVSGDNEWIGPIAVQPGQAIVYAEGGTSLTLSGPVTLANTTHGKLLALGDGNVDISGNISGGANAGDEAVATSGGFYGIMTLSGTNTYVGHTRINNGTLSVAGGSAIPDASRVRLFNSGTLDLQADETIGSLDSTTTSTQVAQILTNANNYSGATRIEDDGTLRLTGAGTIANSQLIHIADTDATFDVSAKAGGFTLGAVQTLKGIGTVDVGGNMLTLEGTLEPGNSIGTLIISGDLTLGDASLSSFEVAGWDAGQYDLVQGSGLYLDETVTFDGLLSVAFDSAVRPGSAMVFDFDHYSDAFAEFTYNGLAGWMTASFDPTTGVLSVVPEPGTWMLLLLALVCALPARRRRG